MSQSPPDPTINGHPKILLPTYQDATGPGVTITVCCECGQLRTILWLTDDRWYCSTCRAAGDRKPKMIPLS